jgi:hypothetical protein
VIAGGLLCGMLIVLVVEVVLVDDIFEDGTGVIGMNCKSTASPYIVDYNARLKVENIYVVLTYILLSQQMHPPGLTPAIAGIDTATWNHFLLDSD